MEETIELTEGFNRALELLEISAKNCFITGPAGTGKSTLLKYFRQNTKKKVVVLAPTGVAALNVQGQTIHSFFCFKPDIHLDNVHTIRPPKSRKKLYMNLDAIVIDEISMVRADLLDAIDLFLRIHGPNPHAVFGGVQMIFFGDLYQLPPVLTKRDEEALKELYPQPYFFNAKCYEALELEIVELEKIYRQKENDFIELLSAVRHRELKSTHLSALNARLQPQFRPNKEDFYIYLTTTNRIADEVNSRYLDSIKDELMTSVGAVDGEFQDRDLPTQMNLGFKVGAQVMLLNNDSTGRWVNGTIGKIVGVSTDDETIRVELEGAGTVDVRPFTWEIFEFVLNEDTKLIESKSRGSFRQFPMRLAWAITIHKSQGKTFKKVILDIGFGTFAHGQLYVALSRCTSLEGLVLKRPIERQHVLLDKAVVEFMGKIKV